MPLYILKILKYKTFYEENVNTVGLIKQLLPVFKDPSSSDLFLFVS